LLNPMENNAEVVEAVPLGHCWISWFIFVLFSVFIINKLAQI